MFRRRRNNYYHNYSRPKLIDPEPTTTTTTVEPTTTTTTEEPTTTTTEPPLSNQVEILTFSISGIVGAAVIDDEEGEILVDVDDQVDLENLTATFTISSGATASPSSPLTGDFSDIAGVDITITAEDGVTDRI